MEQTLLNPTDQKWITDIAELTRQTYQGKLAWSRSVSEPMAQDVFSSLNVVTSSYQAETAHGRFNLSVASPQGSSSYRSPLSVGSEFSAKPQISLTAYDKTGQMLVNYKGFSFLQALADAVEAQEVT